MSAPSEGLRPDGRGPFIVNFGGGVDSTAVLVGLVRQYRAGDKAARPAYILFADTGAEKPETYEHIRSFSLWLVTQGFPEVTWCSRPKNIKMRPTTRYTTLEGNCLVNKTLPSLAFGRKSCSLEWKAEPMDAYLKKQGDVKAAWAAGAKPTKAIGYDAGPADARRGKGHDEDAKFRYWCPLRTWGWTRERCVAEIEAEGLPVPLKSACFFCPASKPAELHWLKQEHPDLWQRALAVERNAQPNLGPTVAGLWRKESWADWNENNPCAACGAA